MTITLSHKEGGTNSSSRLYPTKWGLKNDIYRTEYNISNTQLYNTKYVLITLFRYPRILSSL